MMYVEFMKTFHIADSNELLSVILISACPTQTTIYPIFLHMMYVEFMKNFYHADSNSLMAPK